jgi:hypothetical protein
MPRRWPRRALAIADKGFNPDHPAVATSLNNLAALYFELHCHVEAGPLFKRSLAIRERTRDPNHRDIAMSLNNLASLYTYQVRYADAEPLSKRPLAINAKAPGADHPAVAASIINPVSLYDNQGRFADATRFDPAEPARALAERRAAQTRVAMTRGYGDFWQGAGIDRVKRARDLPSLLDTADELRAVAGKLGAAAADLHLGRRWPTTGWSILRSMVSSPGMSRVSANPRSRSPCRSSRPSLTTGCSPQARWRSSRSMPIGWCCGPATPPTSPGAEALSELARLLLCGGAGASGVSLVG